MRGTARNEPLRTRGDEGYSAPGGRNTEILVRRGRGLLRSYQLRGSVAPFSESKTSQRIGERLRCRGTALHGARQFRAHGNLEVRESNGIPKDAFVERLLRRL